LHCDVDLFVHELGWFRCNTRIDHDLARHYCAPRLFPTREQAFANEKLIKP
jgi:hypothetical protein